MTCQDLTLCFLKMLLPFSIGGIHFGIIMGLQKLLKIDLYHVLINHTLFYLKLREIDA